MTNYEKLLEEASENQLVVREKDLRANKGRIKGNRIAIKKKMPEDMSQTDKNSLKGFLLAKMKQSEHPINVQ